MIGCDLDLTKSGGEGRRAGRSEAEAGEVSADDVVALAGGCFEPLAPDDADASVVARDQAGLLERSHHDGDRGPAHAEHDGQELVFQPEIVGLDTIVRLE